MLFFEIVYILFAILLARVNADLINDGKKIYHWMNGLLHLLAAAWVAWVYWLPCGLIILCNTRCFFDGALNLFRGLPLNYLPVNPKSLVDKLEIKIYGRDWYIPRLTYLSISLMINSGYYVFIYK